MEAPERIYIHPTLDNLMGRSCDSEIEYVRIDTFVNKACEWLKSYRQDTPDGTGYIAGIVNDKTIEDFKNYMEGE